MEEGKFYFIKDDFFNNFGVHLMKNKDKTKRPCYFCFFDEINKNILWFVPVSTKIEKYKNIYNNKIKKYKSVHNFVFGKLHGKDAVFLIQNLFPTTQKYIIEKYITENKDVVVSKNLKEKVIKEAKTIIKLAKINYNVAFYDILSMKEKLLKDELVTN